MDIFFNISLFYTKQMRKWLFLAGGSSLFAQMLVSQKIGYPPSLGQLSLPFSLWLCRFLTLSGLLLTLFFWNKIASKHLDQKTADISCFLILISPVFWGMWLQYPLESIKYLIVFGLWILLENRGLNSNFIHLGVTIILLVVVFFSNGKKLAFLNVLSIEKAQTEVNLRFAKEDELSSKIELPLLERRLTNNKYSMIIRAGLNKLVSFWSLEPIFFQEFNPNSQKALVIFFWPGFLLFIVGLYSEFRRQKEFWWFILGLAYLNFLFLMPKENYEWAFCLFSVSLIMARGFLALSKFKILPWIAIFLYGYAFQAFLFDISKRSDYWLDNRPIIYGNIFKTLKKIDIQEKDRILISDRVGGANKYCHYYLGKKCDNNFSFYGFDLKDKEENDYQYLIGFEGEFLGKDINNVFGEESLNKISKRGFEIIGSYKVRDSVAWQYGNLVAIVKRK